MHISLKQIITGYKQGNTVSELLLTILIAGVVFVIGMGTFIADTNKTQTVSRLQKMYSTISQVFLYSSVKNGPPVNWDFPDKLSDKASTSFFEEYLRPSFSILRDCKNSTKEQCNYVFKDLTGTEKSLNSTWTRFFLSDGAFIALQTMSNDKYKVVYFYVDVNGKKRLNVVGRDIFLFEYWIQNEEHPEYVGKLLPYGHQYSRDDLISDNNENNCNSKKNGNYCGALIMNDSWQIINGYPWAHARYVVK